MSNWFEEARAEITKFKAFSRTRLKRRGLRISRMLLEAAKKHAPDGSKNLDKFTDRLNERPSARFGQVPIAESLKVTVRSGDQVLVNVRKGNVTIGLTSSAEHTKYFTKGIPAKFRGGTKAHRIPKGGEMWQRGYPMTYWHNGVDVYNWTHVDHPGIDLDKLGYGDFLAKAYTEIIPEAQSFLERVNKADLKRVGKIFSKLARQRREHRRS